MLRNTVWFAILIVMLHWAHADPLAVGDRRQLFIDNGFIAEQENITLEMQPPEKLGLILDEQGQPANYNGHIARVLEVDGKVRIYIGADSLSVLESEDGLRFRMTGDRLVGGELSTPFYDPHDPDPARRHKLFWSRLGDPAKFDPATDGIYGAASADGVSFGAPVHLFARYIDNPVVVEWDPVALKYAVFTRTFNYESRNQRQITRFLVDDPLAPWPLDASKDARERLSLLHAPAVLAADADDPPDSDFYYNSATRYPWGDNVWLMMIAPFRHLAPDRNPRLVPPKGGWEDFGFLEVQLAVSRDGATWSRPSREPYVRTGLPTEWDRWYAVMAPGMIRRGDYLYQYYYSSGHLHDSAHVRPEYASTAPRMGGIGVVRQRLDGFVAAAADYRGGSITTPPLAFSGRVLRVNVDAGAIGTVLVELRDANNQSIAGFTLSDCEEIGGNFVNERVFWKGDPDLGALAGQQVRLHFKLVRSKLYAFQFGAE